MAGTDHHGVAGLNALSHTDFVQLIGPVFEHSPWIADLVAAKRPFVTFEQLQVALCETVRKAGEGLQLILIRAHPDVVGRAALAGTLARDAKNAPANAGMEQLTSEEIAKFLSLNQQYQARFGFPFIICARLNRKEAILAGFERRLKHSRPEEIKTALEEIFKIAELRLGDLINH